MTAKEIVARMGVGYNIGNALDATGGNRADVYSQEQSWGNPIIDEALIRRIREAGFTSIRIPVTWFPHTDADHAINPAFLARVRQVVDDCYAHGFIVILNMHHEAWLNHASLVKDQGKIGQQLAAMWQQIADCFADYDQRLIFESMNEPRLAGTDVEWTGSPEGSAAVNYLNQVFVDTIRTDPKGNNAERCLLVPGYAAAAYPNVLEALAFPTFDGKTVNNLIISVHGYLPYEFCLSDQWDDFDPANPQHTAGIDAMFANMKRLFLDRGVPIVLGETGATNTGGNLAARERWAYYIARKAAAYGVPPFIWDNGFDGDSGGECHAWIRRKAAHDEAPCVIPTVIARLMDGAASVEWGGAL